MRRARGAVALVAAGATAALLSVATWRARPADAADLFSFDLNAAAHGFQLFVTDPANGNQEGEVATAQSSLRNGPVGYGLASIAWPGPLAANLGTLLLVASPDVPPEARLLNYPVRAEARTGQAPPSTTYEAVPGLSLQARAEEREVSATSVVRALAGDAGPIGPTRATSTTTHRGASATATASSLVQRVSLAEGAVEIAAIESVAEATTDGRRGDGRAATTVTGLTVAGQTVTVDERGLHVGAQGQPANAIANQIVQQALAAQGIQIVLSAPTKEARAAGASLTAGSLVVAWETPERAFTVVFGGARASVVGAPGESAVVVGAPVDAPGEAGPVPGAVATSGDALVPGPAAVPVEAVAPPRREELAINPAAPAAAAYDEGVGVRPGSVVLAALAATLIAAGLWRLRAPVLAGGSSAPCPLETPR